MADERKRGRGLAGAPGPPAKPRCCYRCGRDVAGLERVGRRDACLGCGSDLHCCRNCRFYDAAYHNQCREPQAERQVDKERGNFCEYFSFAEPGAAGTAESGTARAALDALFSGRRRPSGAAPAKGKRS